QVHVDDVRGALALDDAAHVLHHRGQRRQAGQPVVELALVAEPLGAQAVVVAVVRCGQRLLHGILRILGGTRAFSTVGYTLAAPRFRLEVPMPDRPLRLGDVIDDYCPRCRLLLNHDIASLTNGEIAKVTCRTCYNTHDYRHGQVPTRRSKKKDDNKTLMDQ